MTREEAIRRIKAWNLDFDDMEVLSVVVPELAENEDERTRKEIISALKWANNGGVYDKHIAYLEKQKEQKLVQVNDAAYDYAKSHGTVGVDYEQVYDAFAAGAEWMKKRAKWNPVEWSIKKARPGDVLTTGKVTFIFKSEEEGSVYMYCYYSEVTGVFKISSESAEVSSEYVRPASIEQRTRLFENLLTYIRINSNPKQEWSEEDKKNLESIRIYLFHHGEDAWADTITKIAAAIDILNARKEE